MLKVSRIVRHWRETIVSMSVIKSVILGENQALDVHSALRHQCGRGELKFLDKNLRRVKGRLFILVNNNNRQVKG
jgi:hypothetical protein